MTLMRGIMTLAALLIACPTVVVGADVLGGAVVIRIPDGQPERCINVQSDKVSAVVRRFVTAKKRSWFSESSAVGLIIGTTLEGETSGSTERVTFQRSYLTSVRQYEGDQGLVSLPIEPRILTNFRLTRDSDTFESAEIALRVTNLSRKTALTLIVESLAKITNSLALPPNPYSEGFKFFANYSNDLIGSLIKEDGSGEDVASEGGFTLNFSTDGVCAGDLERTGTIAILYGPTEAASDGMVDINGVNDFCWSAELRPTFVLKAAAKAADGTCPAGVVVRNPYLAVYLNAVQGTLEPGGAETQDLLRAANALEVPGSESLQGAGSGILSPALQDAATALGRCEAHGIAANQCF